MQMGYELIKGRAYNTARALVIESLSGGQLQHRFESFTEGFYAEAFESDVDLIPVVRDGNIVLRYELKCLSNMPDAHCWNQPYRGQFIEDLEKILADEERALIAIFDEAAYLRARGRSLESVEWHFDWRMDNGIVPNDRNIPLVLPPFDDIVANQASLGFHASNGTYNGVGLHVISSVVDVSGVEAREFVQGMSEENPRYRKVGSTYQCGVCTFTHRRAGGVRDHFLEEHSDVQERLTSTRRVICIIATGNISWSGPTN